MRTPAYINTVADLNAAVRIGETCETQGLEFKAVIPDWDVPKGEWHRDSRLSKAKKEACRDVAQFANSTGGCLVIGISEGADPTSQTKVASSFTSVTQPERLHQWLEQAIRRYLVPSTFSRRISAIAHPSGTILAVNVFPSVHAVALWDPPCMEYVRRTDHGKEWLNPDELERHLMDGTRATRLALDSAIRGAGKEAVSVLDGFWTYRRPRSSGIAKVKPPGRVDIGALHDLSFELRIPVAQGMHCLHLPYGVVREVWVSSDNRVNLMLSVRLILDGQQYTFASL